MPRIYGGYSSKELEMAVSCVKSSTMSLRQAAIKFNIPRSTLSDHVIGKISSGSKAGHPPALPPKVEEEICNKAAQAAQLGFGMSRRQVLLRTGRLVRQMQLPTPFKDGIPGNTWWAGMKRRHPDLTIRKPEKLSTSRSQMMCHDVVDKFFTDYAKLLSQGLVASTLWNMDETGVQLEHIPSSVVARKGMKSVPGRVGGNRESISVLACVSAGGKAMPPFCIVKGKTRRSLDAYNVQEAPAGTVWSWQENAWMEDILGEEWFTGVFLRHCGPDRPQLLLLDGHSSHETVGLIEAARKEGIHVLALPAHVTHWLQPLDRSCFGPFKAAYNKICTKFMTENPVNCISKWV